MSAAPGPATGPRALDSWRADPGAAVPSRQIPRVRRHLPGRA